MLFLEFVFIWLVPPSPFISEAHCRTCYWPSLQERMLVIPTPCPSLSWSSFPSAIHQHIYRCTGPSHLPPHIDIEVNVMGILIEGEMWFERIIKTMEATVKSTLIASYNHSTKSKEMPTYASPPTLVPPYKWRGTTMDREPILQLLEFTILLLCLHRFLSCSKYPFCA